MKDTPRLIKFLAYLNFAEGILCALFYLLVIIIGGSNSISEITVISSSLLMLYMCFPVFVGYGLIKGRVWGWLGEVLIFAIISLQCILELYYYFFDSSIRSSGEINWIGALVGLVFSYFVFRYLFKKNIRSFFKKEWGQTRISD